jgi:lipoate-protein ligase B
MSEHAWLVRPPGLTPYVGANRAMHDLARRRLAGDIPDTVVLAQHEPVYTAGRRSLDGHLVWDEVAVRARGASIHHVDRGGSFTFHGPGQLVAYPIIDLGPRPDALGYVRGLEEVVIRAGADLGVELERSDVQTGVWAGRDKVCAIGVRILRMRVTLHGFALNCTTDLSWFDAIVPCGLAGTGVASLSSLAGRRITVADAQPAVIRHLEAVFGLALAAAPEEVAASFEPDGVPSAALRESPRDQSPLAGRRGDRPAAMMVRRPR